MWQVNIENLVKSKLFICRDYHVQPSEIDRLPFFEFEIMCGEIKEMAEKQQEDNEKQREQMPGMPNVNKMMSNIGRNVTSSMPKMPTISIPKF